MANTVVVEHEFRHPHNNGLNMKLHMSVCDGYGGSPLGCHVAMIGNISVTARQVGESQWNSSSHQGAYNAARTNAMTAFDIVDFIQNLLQQGYSHFGSFPKKSHVVISDNYTLTKGSLYYTRDIMEMIVAMCETFPDKFGKAVITEPSRNMSHSGTSSIRTCVWTPAYVEAPNLQEQDPTLWKFNLQTLKDYAELAGFKLPWPKPKQVALPVDSTEEKKVQQRKTRTNPVPPSADYAA